VAQAEIEQSLQLQTERSRGRIVGALVRQKSIPQKHPSHVKNKDRGEKERYFAEIADHGLDSNEPFDAPKILQYPAGHTDPMVRSKDQVHSAKNPRSHLMDVAAARSDSAHAPLVAIGTDEKDLGLPSSEDQICDRRHQHPSNEEQIGDGMVAAADTAPLVATGTDEEVLGLPSFKDQICDRRHQHPSNEEQIGDGMVAAADTCPSKEAQEDPAYKDQVRNFVFKAKHPLSPAIVDPSVVFADACLLDPSDVPTRGNTVFPAHVLSENTGSSFVERTKKELAEKDAEIQRLKKQIEALARATNKVETADRINESVSTLRPNLQIQRLKEQVEAMSNVSKEVNDQQSPPKPSPKCNTQSTASRN